MSSILFVVGLIKIGIGGVIFINDFRGGRGEKRQDMLKFNSSLFEI
ncbi:MAG: hypothetical protein KDD45_00560 [Bdellovibrionales bacterium]|nr:hypothetical protein [Bdellovibrionales bacterium]